MIMRGVKGLRPLFRGYGPIFSLLCVSAKLAKLLLLRS